MADERVIIEIDFDQRKVDMSFKQIEQKAKVSGKKAGESFSAGLQGSISSFLGNIGAMAFARITQEIKSMFDGMIDAAKKVEVIEVQFKTLLGSAAAAQKQISDLQKFAASTPFQLEGLALATRQLLSFGVAQKDIVPTLTQLGDLAAGAGARIDELTIPFGRLIATQKLTLMELDKFADRGINVYGKLAERTGRSVKNIRDDISKGRIAFEDFTGAITDMTSKGGKFFRGMAAQSKTLTGVLSTLNDNIFNLQSKLGRLFVPFLVKSTNETIKRVQKATDFIAANGKQVITTIAAALRGATKVLLVPVEVMFNVVKLLFSGVKTSIQIAISAIGAGVGRLARFLMSLPGLEESPLGQKMLDFASSTKEQLDSALAGTKEAIEGVFDTSLSEKANSMINEFERISLAAQQMGLKIAPAMKKAVEALKAGSEEMSKDAQNLVKNLDKSLNQGLANIISKSIQRMTMRMAQGKSVFADFGNFLINMFGDLAIQIGTMIIAFGLAIAAFQASLFSSPLAAVALGAGLVAVGAAMKAFAGGGGPGPVGGTATAGGAGGGVPVDDITEESDLREVKTTEVIVNVQGDIMDSDETGSRIVQLINNAFDKDGVVVNRGAIA